MCACPNDTTRGSKVNRKGLLKSGVTTIRAQIPRLNIEIVPTTVDSKRNLIKTNLVIGE